MRNPFRSESSAFHFLVLTVVAFGIVAAASATGGSVAAVVAWALVSVVVAALYLGARPRTEPAAVPHAGPPDERRIVVVAPLTASPLHLLANDVDLDLSRARSRAEEVAHTLVAPHVRAEAAVGEDPLTAVDDLLRTFGGDEIVVLPGDDSLPGRLRERYALPVAAIDA